MTPKAMNKMQLLITDFLSVQYRYDADTLSRSDSRSLTLTTGELTLQFPSEQNMVGAALSIADAIQKNDRVCDITRFGAVPVLD